MRGGQSSEALSVGGYASADSAEEHGGTRGFARGAPSIHQKEGVYEAENDSCIVDHPYWVAVDGLFVNGQGEARGARND